jgi:hypothetical protein
MIAFSEDSCQVRANSSFTAIGIWYLECATPPDEERASKCFQKAFELDATEAEAARRLATGYAMEGEWALVLSSSGGVAHSRYQIPMAVKAGA